MGELSADYAIQSRPPNELVNIGVLGKPRPGSYIYAKHYWDVDFIHLSSSITSNHMEWPIPGTPLRPHKNIKKQQGDPCWAKL